MDLVDPIEDEGRAAREGRGRGLAQLSLSDKSELG